MSVWLIRNSTGKKENKEETNILFIYLEDKPYQTLLKITSITVLFLSMVGNAYKRNTLQTVTGR